MNCLRNLRTEIPHLVTTSERIPHLVTTSERIAHLVTTFGREHVNRASFMLQPIIFNQHQIIGGEK